MISKEGVHYRQLIQKFLSVAVNFSQGTNDYLLTDFGSALDPYKDKTYSVAAHKFDEGFGYYGASRDMNDYSDDEAAGKGGHLSRLPRHPSNRSCHEKHRSNQTLHRICGRQLSKSCPCRGQELNRNQ